MWQNEIMPKVLKGEKVLVVAHGTVVRSLMKHIEGENLLLEKISKVSLYPLDGCSGSAINVKRPNHTQLVSYFIEVYVSWTHLN